MSEQIQTQLDEYEPLPAPLKTRVQFAGGTILAGGVIDLFAHGGVTGLAMAGLAAYVAWRHSGDLSEAVRKRYASLDTHSQESLAKFTNWARNNSVYAEHLPEMNVRDEGKPKESEREETQQIAMSEDEYNWYGEEDEEVLPPMGTGMFTFMQVLEKGFTPTLKNIYVGSHPDGTPIYVEAKDLCHVALAGNTGGGKSSLMRMLMVQLCKAGAIVLLLNPHYTPYDREHEEDWTPFTPYLKEDPLICAEYANIEYYLKTLVEHTLPKRQERVRAGLLPGKPYFVVIDELPAVVSKCSDVPRYMSELLREGRKYGIFLIVASQDFLVATIGTEGGAVRQCFRTAFYVGGDATTARNLLEKGVSLPETSLGKGTILLRCSTTKQSVLAKVPYVENESLYRLLGPSTFHRDKVQENREDDLVAPVQPESLAPTQQTVGMTVEQLATLLTVVKPEQSVPTPKPVIQPADQMRIEWAFRLWEGGHNSVRKLESASGWSNGETRRIIRLMKEQGMISEENSL